MQQITSSDRVRLVDELSELQLLPGEVGVVRQSWHFPNIAYEVEFRPKGRPMRVLLLNGQIAPAGN